MVHGKFLEGDYTDNYNLMYSRWKAAVVNESK